MTFSLSILDQSPIQNSEDATKAICNTLELSQLAEKWGYHRYWVAEHHGTKVFAGSAPEILMGKILEQTKDIRVGSGGVMLSHYSPYKVAEVFQTLSLLYPNRVDFGFGKAPGGSNRTTLALNYPLEINNHSYSLETFNDKANLLIQFLQDKLSPEHFFGKIKVIPHHSHSPEMWLLGASLQSSNLAATLGIGLAASLFIKGLDLDPHIFHHYHQSFLSQHQGKKSHLMLALSFMCANSLEEAKFLARTYAYWSASFKSKKMVPLIPPEKVNLKNMNLDEKALYNLCMDNLIMGTPHECKEQIEKLQEKYQSQEIILVNVTYDFSVRKKMYEEMAQIFQLKKRP